MVIQENVALAPKTTIKVGGTACYFAEVKTLAELADAIRFARDKELPVLVLGGGSNLILPDDPYPGLVLSIVNDELTWDEERHQIRAGAAVPMERLVRETTERGWAGLQDAGGLPGTIGGAIRGNAGCFGWEIKDHVASVVTIDPQTLVTKVWQPKECQFGYRTSRFKADSQIIWEAILQFERGEPEVLTRIRDERILYRKTHHPQAPSAGSIFQNLPVSDLPTDFFQRFPELQTKVKAGKLPTGALLESLGLKGERRGGAMISNEHANIVINAHQAQSADVRVLVAFMKDKVRSHYGIELHEEPQFI